MSATYDTGYVLVDVMAAAVAVALGERCFTFLAGLTPVDLLAVDRQHGGTLHLGDVASRVPGAAAVADALDAVAATFVDGALGPRDVSFRCPQPGYGGQRLHADAVPLTASNGPFRTVTAIVALCPFTADNGATALVPGSHRRPDQQRGSGRMTDHPDETVVTCDAGTAIVFNGHVLHRGRRNTSTAPRPALQIVWESWPDEALSSRGEADGDGSRDDHSVQP